MLAMKPRGSYQRQSSFEVKGVITYENNCDGCEQHDRAALSKCFLSLLRCFLSLNDACLLLLQAKKYIELKLSGGSKREPRYRTYSFFGMLSTFFQVHEVSNPFMQVSRDFSRQVKRPIAIFVFLGLHGMFSLFLLLSPQIWF